jgi:hypothetical protein
MFALLGEREEAGDLPGNIHAILTHCTNRDGVIIDARIVVPNETGQYRIFSRSLNTQLIEAAEDVSASEAVAPEETVTEVEVELRTSTKEKTGE